MEIFIMRKVSKITERAKDKSRNQMEQVENISILIHEGVMPKPIQVMKLIDSIYYDVRNKRDEIIERTSIYKKSLGMSITNPRYREVLTTNREISQFREELMKTSSMVFMAIDYALSKNDISSLQFLLLQKERFNQYCWSLRDYLHAYFEHEECDLEEKSQNVFEFRESIINGNREYIKK